MKTHVYKMGKEQKHTLLIIRMSALGDVAMCIPVIYSFARQYQEWQVIVLTQTFFSQLFVDAPANISFIMADLKGKHKGVIGLFRLIKEINKHPIESVADFHNVLRSWVIDLYFTLKAIPISIVRKKRRDRRKLTQGKDKNTASQRSYILRYADVLKELYLPVTLDFTSLFPDKRIRPAIPISMPQDNIKGCIGIAPFARYNTKTYPIEKMEQVVKALSAQGYALYLFGNKGKEKNLLDNWEHKYPSCKSIPGLLSIQEELILMSQLDVMISMDSANMHLASLVGTPVISIWGSTTPQCGFMGWKQNEHNAICLQLPCQPCSIAGTKDCRIRNFDCMNGICSDTIIQKVKQLIKQKNNKKID